MKKTLVIAAAALSLFAADASAAIGDATLDAGISAGTIGEQADGYLGAVSGKSLSAELRARVDQVNIRRRAVYTERAGARGVSVEEMARATACTLLVKNTPAGAYYRDEGGQWRKNAGAVTLPSYCPK